MGRASAKSMGRCPKPQFLGVRGGFAAAHTQKEYRGGGGAAPAPPPEVTLQEPWPHGGLGARATYPRRGDAGGTPALPACVALGA